MAAELEKRMVQVWWSYCPLGDCRKGNSTLGRSYSEHRARQRIFDHVYGSPAHQANKDDAQALADAANEIDHTLITEEIEEEVWQPNVPEPPNKRQRSADWERNSSNQQAVAKRNSGELSGDLGRQIQQQTRNAFIFVKARICER